MYKVGVKTYERVCCTETAEIAPKAHAHKQDCGLVVVLHIDILIKQGFGV